MRRSKNVVRVLKLATIVLDGFPWRVNVTRAKIWNLGEVAIADLTELPEMGQWAAFVGRKKSARREDSSCGLEAWILDCCRQTRCSVVNGDRIPLRRLAPSSRLPSLHAHTAGGFRGEELPKRTASVGRLSYCDRIFCELFIRLASRQVIPDNKSFRFGLWRFKVANDRICGPEEAAMSKNLGLPETRVHSTASESEAGTGASPIRQLTLAEHYRQRLAKSQRKTVPRNEQHTNPILEPEIVKGRRRFYPTRMRTGEQ